jgi:hypothetical protein
MISKTNSIIESKHWGTGQRHPCLSNREWVELRNVTRSCHIHGRSQSLHFRGRRAAAALYRKNWVGCRDLWKLDYHRKKVKFTVL